MCHSWFVSFTNTRLVIVIHSLHECNFVICAAPAIDTQWRSGKQEECIKVVNQTHGCYRGQCRTVASRGHQPPYHCWVVPPSNQHACILRACCWLWCACCRVFLQSRMSQTFRWCNLCQSFIYSLLQTPSWAIIYSKLEICILYKDVKQ